MRFEGENTTDSSSTTSAEREEIERLKRISETAIASSVSPSLVDLGKF